MTQRVSRSALSWRQLLRGGAAILGIAAAQLAWPGMRAAAAAPRRQQPDPNTALQRLLDGNQRFVSDVLLNPNRSAERRAQVAPSQEPFAVILGCSDSRVSPEVIFDQGVGDLFVVRVAGNVVTDEGAASIEYAVTTFGTPLVLVLGHNRCGAVQAAVKVASTGATLPGSLPALVRALQPAVTATKRQPGDPVENAGRANVSLAVGGLTAFDASLADRVRSGSLRVAGGYYDLDTGLVEIIA